MNSTEKVNFKGLNVLRFFSVLAIILYHATMPFMKEFREDVQSFIFNLPLGVDMFFLISGFLIVYLLLAEKENGGISLLKFYARRMLRIFPLYFLIVGLSYWHYEVSHPEIDFTKFLYFWGNFWMIHTNNWTVDFLNPLWSLCVEEHFYLVIPILLIIIPIKKANYLFIGIILFSLSCRVYAYYKVEWPWMTLYLHTLSRCDLLAAGGLIAYYHKLKKISLNHSNVYFYLLLLILMSEMIFIPCFDYTNLLKATLKKYVFAAPMVILFILTLFNKTEEKNFTNSIKNSGVLNYLGKISFGMYMYHSVAIHMLIDVPWAMSCYFFFIPLAFVLTVIFSVISFELFEKQFLQLKGRFEIVKTSN